MVVAGGKDYNLGKTPRRAEGTENLDSVTPRRVVQIFGFLFRNINIINILIFLIF